MVSALGEVKVDFIVRRNHDGLQQEENVCLCGEHNVLVEGIGDRPAGSILGWTFRRGFKSLEYS